MFSLHVCMCTVCMPSACRGQTAPDPPELELWTAVSLHVGAGNRIRTSARPAGTLLLLLTPLQPLLGYFKLHIWLALFFCDNTATEAADLTIC